MYWHNYRLYALGWLLFCASDSTLLSMVNKLKIMVNNHQQLYIKNTHNTIKET